MVERKITPDSEDIKRYRKTGVVIFILNQQRKLLATKETVTHDTDGGQQGEISVTCETSIPGEHWSETVFRGLKEELGEKVVETNPFALDPENCFIGESVFGTGVLARVVILHYVEDPEIILNASGDGEVNVVGWMKPEELLAQPLRPGVRKMLKECIANDHLQTNSFGRNLIPLSVKTLRACVRL